LYSSGASCLPRARFTRSAQLRDSCAGQHTTGGKRGVKNGGTTVVAM
jgi:hypothetical protein